MLERQIENRLITQLQMMGYQLVKFDKSFTMEDNIRDCLNKVFKKDYTSEEIKKILKKIQIETDKTMKYAYGFNEILENGLYLQLRSGEKMSKENSPYIRLIDRSGANNNIFQVAHQLTDVGNESSRYDVTILINGFPIVQVELKRADVELNEAINQINRYKNRAFTGLFQYLQLFIVSNDTETKYGLNTVGNINKLFMFNWSDEKNVILNDLTKFTDSFLTKHNLFDMITKYIIRYKTGDHKMVVLRPYQIYAIKSVLNRVTLPSSVRTNRKLNGYVFHTTGSGKTLTSWKCVEMIQSLPDVAKVIFLVDRRDLDVQTTAEFKAIDSNIDIEDTDNTDKLLKAFEYKKSIITTIQKMSIAIKNAKKGTCEESYKKYTDIFTPYKDKRVVFIIDECHRTQYGSMHMVIENFFENSLYIGFTGTPIFEENKGAALLTTKDLFGEELHTYRIKDAIQNKNVLGFSVDYYDTVKGKNLLGEDESLEEACKQIDDIEILHHEDRISNIVRTIFDIHNKKTQNRKYTALFTVDSINLLIKYYNEFKRQNELIENPDERLKVSAIFTANDTEEEKQELDNNKSASYRKIVEDFNKLAHTNCSIDADKNDTFRAELVKGLKRDKNTVDIVLVVGIFLTGFDSKMTNTIYIDRSLEWHSLLQAFSRTNRVESPAKPFGNVVCFRNLKDKVDDSVALFNYGKDKDSIISKSYEAVLTDLIKSINDIWKIVPDDFVVSNQPESVKEEFVKSMRNLNQQLTQAKQFAEFSWDVIKDILPMDSYQKMVGQLKTIKEETDTSEDKFSALKYIDFCIELVEQDTIDLDYIKRLIRNIDLSTYESLQISVNEIIKLLHKSNSDTLRTRKEILIKFLEKLVLDSKQSLIDNNKLIVENDIELREYFIMWLLQEQKNQIETKVQETGLSEDDIQREIIRYDIVEKVDNAELTNKISKANSGKKLGLKEKRTLRERLAEFISNFSKTFKGFTLDD